MNKITVIGAGSFGTALANILSEKNEVTLISRDNDVINSINNKHKNNKYFPNIILNCKLSATSKFSIVSKAQFVILAVPSHSVIEIIKTIVPYISENTILINTAKGFSKSGKNILEELKNVHKKSFSILGPTFANNLIKGEYSGFTIVGDNKNNEFLPIMNIFKGTNIIFDHSTNIKAIETASILKNIFAIAMGLYDSIDDSINTKFLFLTQCYKEMTLILNKYNLDTDDFSKFAVFGDLLLTSLNDQSRNKTFGQLIGRGFYTVNHDKKILFEGERSVKYIYDFAIKNDLKLPIVFFVKSVLDGENILLNYHKCLSRI